MIQYSEFMSILFGSHLISLCIKYYKENLWVKSVTCVALCVHSTVKYLDWREDAVF
jgi:hypothetical protein